MKPGIRSGIGIALIIGSFALFAHIATRDIPEDVIEERLISDEQRILDIKKEHERIEFEIRKERERRKVEADIRSMYLPAYLSGC